MGKETKIGLAVLAALVIVFGVVVYKRLTRTPDETVATTAEGNVKPSTPDKPDTPGDDWKQTSTTVTASKPMVLSPAKTSSGAAPHSPEDVTSQWLTATDPPKKSGGADAVLASDLPPAGAASPPPPADDSYGPSSAARQASPLSPTPAARSDAAAMAPAKQAADPFQGRADRYTPAAAPAPLAAEGGSAARTVEPPPASASASRDLFSSQPSRDSYSAAAPPPTYRQTPRDSFSAAAPSPSYADAGRTFARSAPPPAGDADSFSHAGGSYEVQPNDNYWLISQKVYGNGAYFKALAEHNRGKVPERDKLRVGDSISTPTVAQLEQTYPELCPKPSHRETVRNRATLAGSHGGYGARTYEVQEGDTLFDIARNELGKATRWAEIYDLNRDALGKDFDYLTPGMQLTLPPKDAPAAADKTTRRPASVYDR